MIMVYVMYVATAYFLQQHLEIISDRQQPGKTYIGKLSQNFKQHSVIFSKTREKHKKIRDT